MELFVVNRCEGEEPKPDDQTQDHLLELLKKIEERKKQKAAAADPVEPQDSTGIFDGENEKSSSKRKKRKKSSANEIDINDDVKKICLDADVTGEKSVEDPNKKNGDIEKTKIQDFMVLGEAQHKKRKIVKRVLPKWLANPEIISADLSTGLSLDELNDKLDTKFTDILRSNGVEKLFPVQGSLINWMVKCKNDRKMGFWPRDTCVSAPTGSGKTLAYVLPVVDQLQHRFVRQVRCLIVLPVKELALQVFKVVHTYTTATDLRVGLISGSVAFETEQTNLVKKTQNGEYVSRVDIVIATPGRLVDHIEKTEGFSLANLEFLIIDEADRTTEWLKYIPEPHRSAQTLSIKNIKSCKIPPAQKLLFSATLSQDPEKLSRLGLFKPILFTSVVSDRDEDINLDKEIGDFVGRYTSPKELTERSVECKPEYKPVVLVKLIMSQVPIEKTLVFTNSGDAAHRLAILLGLLLSKNNIKVDELSAQLAPKQRIDVLEKFALGHVQVLVSSDALARGVDIAGVKLVVSYDLTKHIEGYIHRAGRTGRAGLPGTAISILTSNQVNAYTRMLTTGHKALPSVEQIESLDTYAETIDYQLHLDTFKDIIENEKIKEADKIKSAKRKHFNNNKNQVNVNE